ncbi:MAG: DEAD/DEAH box helicase [Gemmatimonadetes bacterium]|nr:DEAD/DEAH box helicase [Gemmatimonadota bacterium]
MSPQLFPPGHPQVESVLRERFWYPAFRPGQWELVEEALNGRDAMGILPTGGGKTVCYQVPALLLPGATLVISPLVSLMEDQLRRARSAGLEAVALHSPSDARVHRSFLDSTPPPKPPQGVGASPQRGSPAPPRAPEGRKGQA